MGNVIKTAIISAEPRRTVAQVAASVGVSYNVLNNVLNGRTKPPTDLVESIRKELGLPKGWPFEEELLPIKGIPLVRIELMGKVMAGSGSDVYESGDATGEGVVVPANLGGPDKGALVIEGDSMFPLLHPGDVAVFRKSHVPKLGCPCVVRTKDGKLRVKVVGHDGTGYTFTSLNPAYPADKNGKQMLGFLIGIYRTVGSREEITIDESGIRP